MDYREFTEQFIADEFPETQKVVAGRAAGKARFEELGMGRQVVVLIFLLWRCDRRHRVRCLLSRVGDVCRQVCRVGNLSWVPAADLHRCAVDHDRTGFRSDSA